MDLPYYQGKIVVVTGASSGIGAGTAEEIARQGACVVLVARRENKLQDVAGRIAAAGGHATPVPCDITDEGAVRQAARAVYERFGQVHLLVNNAGRQMTAPLQLTSPEEAMDLTKLNLLGMVTVTRHLLPALKKGSSVVNVSSVHGLRGASCASLYAATKGACLAWTRAMARELAPRGVRVNAVAPGMVRTALLEDAFRKLKPEQVAALEAQHPLGLGEVRDVALAIAFLGSDAARWITGHTLVVDGGFSC